MKRSEINQAIKEAQAMMKKFNFYLPEWADWTPEDWQTKGHECDEIRRNALGWDVTDFSKGNFKDEGLTLVTMRNGNLEHDDKTYCEKIMYVQVNQKTPTHFHWNKMEDIIHRGGGTFCMKLWKANKDEEKTYEPFDIQIDGVTTRITPGEVIRLHPGQSISYVPYIYHVFWAEGEPCLVGEVSKVNDDNNDNRFYEPTGRYPGIEEDEKPYRLLCNEYPEAK